MKTIIAFICVIIFLSHHSFCQSISNVIATQQGNNALISYDLNGTPGNSYYVRLSYSTDGGQTFGNELTQVSGDVKGGVKPGTGKKITWAADKEVNYLNSSVIFKVEAETRKANAKPVTIDNVTVEIVTATRNGEDVIIDFKVVQNSEREILNINLMHDSKLTAQDGTQYAPVNGKLGTSIMGTYWTKDVECQKGIPAKGSISFKVDNNDVVFLALKIDLYCRSSTLSFVLRNVPIQ